MDILRLPFFEVGQPVPKKRRITTVLIMAHYCVEFENLFKSWVKVNT